MAEAAANERAPGRARGAGCEATGRWRWLRCAAEGGQAGSRGTGCEGLPRPARAWRVPKRFPCGENGSAAGYAGWRCFRQRRRRRPVPPGTPVAGAGRGPGWEEAAGEPLGCPRCSESRELMSEAVPAESRRGYLRARRPGAVS